MYRAYRFRFLFVCISVLHLVAFMFAYRIARGDGLDWFEITSNDVFVRKNSFHELESLLICNPFWCKIFRMFCKYFLF